MINLEDLNNGGVSIKANTPSTYEELTFKIVSSTAVQGPDPKSDIPLVRDFEGVYLLLTLECLEGENKGVKFDVAGSLLTRSGEVACYPPTDKFPKGSFLWDIKEAIKAYKESQLKKGWMDSFTVKMLEGLTLRIHARFIGLSFILLTSSQIERDKRYQESKAANTEVSKTASVESESNESKAEWLNDGKKLPF